jgi:hypothetical protein
MRVQLVSADIKIPFGIRLPNGLAPSLPRPMALVSHSEIRYAAVTICKVWISNSRQKRDGKMTSPLCSCTIQSKGKYAIMHRCYGDESQVKFLTPKIHTHNKAGIYVQIDPAKNTIK